jgi:hypothetical protein
MAKYLGIHERFSKQLIVRVSDDVDNLVRSVAAARGEDISDFIRRSLLKELASLGFVGETQAKALGISKVKS